ncbi:MAG: hypothetical protein HUU55_12785 [Myxococcales bacterium]|nr:hypothetical protein [Myxococcales bacterium]
MSIRKQLVACACVAGLVSSGCYSTYYVPKSEFERLQSVANVESSVVVKSDDGEGVEVNRDTSLYVRSNGGRRYPVTPFNFKITQSQLVASDRDTLLALNDVASYEVDHLSIGWTATLIAIGAAAAAGIIVYTVLSTGEKSFGE